MVRTPAAVEGGHIGRDGEKKGPNFFFSGAQKKAIRSRKVRAIILRAIDAAATKGAG